MLLPAYDFGSPSGVCTIWCGPSGVIPGWGAFLHAMLGDARELGFLAWLANPLLWIALLLVAGNRAKSWSIALATVASASAAAGVLGWLQTSQASDVIVLPGVYAWLVTFPLAAFGALLRPWDGQAFLARTSVRLALRGAVLVAVAGAGAMAFGLLD